MRYAWFLGLLLLACSAENPPQEVVPFLPLVKTPVVIPIVDAGSDADFVEPDRFPTLLGSYSTKFLWAEARAKNIDRALFAPIILDSEEEFSFNKTVGPRTVANGFVEAPVIFMGEVEKGVGGGVCQVSSTLHAAAWYAALDIVERQPHSRPSKYIPLGLDATVSFPEECQDAGPECYAPDLRIRNQYNFPVRLTLAVSMNLAQPRVAILTAEVWGRGRNPPKLTYSFQSVRREDFKQRIKKVPGKTTGYFHKAQKGLAGQLVTGYLKGPDLKTYLRSRSNYPATDEIWEVAEDWPENGPFPWDPLDAGLDSGLDAGVGR
jgi:hypothetical protein